MSQPPHPTSQSLGRQVALLLAGTLACLPAQSYQPVPLLKRRLELSRGEALKRCSVKRQQGWQPTTSQWGPPREPAQG